MHTYHRWVRMHMHMHMHVCVFRVTVKELVSRCTVCCSQMNR